ncbi:MAG: hypothetical protein ACK2UW_23630 [Anaerolineales bacterium]|jgi:hypothetical protein
MDKTIQVAVYLDLLEIRKKAYQRNTYIGGGLFVLAILATTGTFLLTDWNFRSIWLMCVFAILFTMNFLMAWTRYEILNQNIDLLKNIPLQD